MSRVAMIALALAPGRAGAGALHGQRLEYLGGGAGVVVPAGSFGDVDKEGWHVSALGIGRVKGPVRFVIDALYGRTTHQGGVAGSSTLAGGTISAALFLAAEPRRLRPFVSVGVGVFRASVGVPGFGTAAATKLARAGGAGLLLGRGRRRGLLAVRYVSIGTSPQTTSFISVGAGVVLARGSP